VLTEDNYTVQENTDNIESIHPYILKACAQTLYTPLTILFYQSLTSGISPVIGKEHV